MSDSQFCAFVLLSSLAAVLLGAAAIDAIRDAFRHANRTMATGIAICADPIDAHFATAITEPEFYAETFADLRAPWAKWEQEMTA